MLKVAIIGLGIISTVHRRMIENSALAELVAVCDIDSTRFADYEGVACYTEAVEMLDGEQLDCVHICLPHYLHLPLTKLCAEKGINVFVEKPLGLNYSQCREMFDLEEKHGMKIGVCLQNRYNETTISAKKLIDSGELGEFIGAKGIVTWCRNSQYYIDAPWRGIMAQSGGGAIINQAIHTLDLLYHLGGEIAVLEAKTANFTLKETEIEDSAMVSLRYKNGAQGVFFATIAHCTNSSIQLEFVFEKEILSIADSKLYRCNHQGTERHEVAENRVSSDTKIYYGSEHGEAINRFHRAIIEGTDDYIHVDSAAYCIRLLDMINESNKTEKPVQI